MKIIALGTLAAIFASGVLLAKGNADLIRLYEEEILAHDLYVELSKTHPDIMPLKNIPQSEKRHQEMMSLVLKESGIKLPEPKKGRKFVTKGLDKTYKRWLKEGLESEQSACRVGVRLEEHDIADLRKAVVDFPQHADTLNALEQASGNHLRAFHRNLSSRDGNYKAEAMSEEELKAILSDSKGNGQCGKDCGKGCGSECGCGSGCGGKGKGKGAQNSDQKPGAGKGMQKRRRRGQQSGGSSN